MTDLKEVKIDQNIEENMSSVINVSDIPLDMLSSVKIQDILDTSLEDQYSIWKAWKPYLQRDITQLYECKHVIRDVNLQSYPHLERHIHDCIKFSFMAYTSPHLFLSLTANIFDSNYHFQNIMYQIMSESSQTAYRVMNQINANQINFLETDGHVGGFYIRTPIRMWNAHGRRVYQLPPYIRREELTKYRIEGNVNAYVIREPIIVSDRKTSTNKFRLRVLFRGTSNDFNGIPQYGHKFSNTQVFSLPTFDPTDNKTYSCGSSSKALFMKVYVDLVRNVWPHVKQCLRWLRIDSSNCQEVVVTGHSMGAAMTLVLNYLLHSENIEWWQKFQFVAIAAPTCANDKAVQIMEQRCIDCKQPFKVIEVINNDDFVNLHYNLGDEKGIERSISCGIVHTVAWLLNHIFEQDPNDNFFQFDKRQRDNILLQLMKQYTNELACSFINGVFHGQYQTSTNNMTLGTRIGYRRPFRALWGTYELNNLVNDTFALIVCKRHPNYGTEYIGKCHTDYMYVNYYAAWKHTRMFEDRLYHFLQKHNLRHSSNSLKIIPFMSQYERSIILQKVKRYKKSY